MYRFRPCTMLLMLKTMDKMTELIAVAGELVNNIHAEKQAYQRLTDIPSDHEITLNNLDFEAMVLTQQFILTHGIMTRGAFYALAEEASKFADEQLSNHNNN